MEAAGEDSVVGSLPRPSSTTVVLSFLLNDEDGISPDFLSLSPPSSQDNGVIHAEPIGYSLPPPSSTSGTTTVVDLSFLLDEEDGISPNFLSLSLPSSQDSGVSGTTTVVDLSFMLDEDGISPNFLSLSPPFPEDTVVIDAEPTRFSLPSSTSATTTFVDLSFILEDDDIDSSFLSLSLPFYENPSNPEVSKNPSEPTLSLFPQVSENLAAASKSIGNNTPVQCSVGSHHSSAKTSLFKETGEDEFVPVKKIKIGKDSTVNNPKRLRTRCEEEGHWITKSLTKSDVKGWSTLLLPREDVKNYILPFMNEEQQDKICHDLCGIDVTVYDMDTQTEHILNLRRWPTGSFCLVKAWPSEFVKRRNLKEDDVIWIRWERNNSRFCFRVHARNQV